MAELPKGYKEIPEADRKKAEVFFTQGRKVADTGNYEYAIEMFIQGLNLDPDSIEAHQQLRDYSLKRKAMGGKPMGMMDKMKLKKGKEDKDNMLVAEKLLAYDPGSTDHMLTMIQSAHKGGFFDTVMWLGPILLKANQDSGKGPDFNKFNALKSIYIEMEMWKHATEAAQNALMIKPDDMDLQSEVKNLGVRETMQKGNYESGKSFRDSMKDVKGQEDLLEQEKDVRSVDSLKKAIDTAEAEYKAEPNEPGKLIKYVDALLKAEQTDYENRAIEALEEAFTRTKQFRFRQKIGAIRLAQLKRMERNLRSDAQAAPNDASKQQQWKEFLKEKTEEELKEYSLWSENYPTDMSFRFEVARRLFALRRWEEAIPAFQEAQRDPKFRGEAGTLLGRAFLEAEFVEEAVDTLKGVIDEYLAQGDEKSKQMHYWYGRALESKGDTDQAIKAFSQVARWDFNYADVQARIKKLRNELKAPPPPPATDPEPRRNPI